MKTIQKEISRITSSFFHRKSVFRNTFFIILFILLTLLLVFQLIMYRESYKSLNNSLKESNQSYISTVAALTDEKLAVLQSEINDLAWSDVLIDSMVFPQNRNNSRNFDIITDLKKFVSSRSYISKIVLRCNADGSFYSSEGKVGINSTEVPVFKSSAIAAIKSSKEHSIDSFLLRSDTGDYIFCYDLIRYSRGHLGTMFVYFSPELFFSEIIPDDNTIAIYTNGYLLYSANKKTPEYDMISDTYSTVESGIMDLTVCKPYEVRSYPIITFLQSNYFFIFLPLLIILALAAAWFFYKPLYTTLNTISQPGISGNHSNDDWTILNNAINELTEQSSKFGTVVDMMEPFVQSRLLQELAEGNIKDNSIIIRTLQSIGSLLPSTGNFVLYNMRNASTGVFKATELDRILNNISHLQIAGYAFYSFSHNYSILTLMSADNTPTTGVIDGVSQSIAVNAHSSDQIVMTRSMLFHELLQLSDAYQETLTPSSNYSQTDAGRISSEQIQSNIIETIDDYVNYSEEEACCSVSHFTALITSADISAEEKEKCISLLSNQLILLAKSYNIQTDSYNLADYYNPSCDSVSIEIYERKLIDLIHQIFVNLDNRQRQYLLAAKNYIEENYSDTNLSLTSIAEYLGISSSYLSRLFSNTYGIRFTQYLNDIRINHAIELLADESKFVKDIGLEVGFSTTQNFMRVFKSRTGVSPGDYRSAIPNVKDN